MQATCRKPPLATLKSPVTVITAIAITTIVAKVLLLVKRGFQLPLTNPLLPPLLLLQLANVVVLIALLHATKLQLQTLLLKDQSSIFPCLTRILSTNNHL